MFLVRVYNAVFSLESPPDLDMLLIHIWQLRGAAGVGAPAPAALVGGDAAIVGPDAAIVDPAAAVVGVAVALLLLLLL